MTAAARRKWDRIPDAIGGGICRGSDKRECKTATQSEAPRGLAGKPLAGFRATPIRRIPVLCGMIVYVIHFNNQLLHR